MIWEKILETKSRKIKVYPQHVNRASSASHPCIRFLVWSRTRWAERKAHTAELQMIFDEGNRHEEALVSDLREAGYIIGEERRTFEDKRYELTGKIDRWIEIDGELIPLEIKSMNPFTWQSLRPEAEAIKNHKDLYIRLYYGQINLYLFLLALPRALMLFKNKSNGALKEIWVDLDYAYTEKVLQQLEIVNKIIKEKLEVPECDCPNPEWCPFNQFCFPARDFGSGMGIIIDAELEAMLERRAETKISRDEYEALDEVIKAKFRGHEGIVECGRFEVKTTFTPDKIYTEAVVPKPRPGFWTVRIQQKG